MLTAGSAVSDPDRLTISLASKYHSVSGTRRNITSSAQLRQSPRKLNRPRSRRSIVNYVLNPLNDLLSSELSMRSGLVLHLPPPPFKTREILHGIANYRSLVLGCCYTLPLICRSTLTSSIALGLIKTIGNAIRVHNIGFNTGMLVTPRAATVPSQLLRS